MDEGNVVRTESTQLPLRLRFDKISQKHSYILLCIALIVFATLDYSRLSSSTVGFGIDGYYYVLQIESLRDSGEFYFATTTPTVLYFLAGLNVIFQETVTSVKLGALILHLLLSIGIFGLVSHVTTKRSLGLLSVIFLNVSGLHLYLIVEFINQLGAITFMACGFWFLLLAKKNWSVAWLVAGLGFFFLAAASHKSALPIIASLFLTSGLFLLATSDDYRKRLVGTALLIFLFLSPALLALQSFIALPFELHKELLIFPAIPFSRSNWLEVTITLVVSLFTFTAFRWSKTPAGLSLAHIALGTIAVWSFLITLNPLISSEQGFLSVGGRLRTLAYIQVALAVPALISAMHVKRSFTVVLATIAVVAITFNSAVSRPPFGAHPDYLDRRSRLIQALRSVELVIEPNSVIVATHGDQFVVTAATGVSSQQMPPVNYDNQVYWLLDQIPPSLAYPSMKILAIDREGFQTVLVKDDEMFRERLRTDVEAKLKFTQFNRHLRRHLHSQQ